MHRGRCKHLMAVERVAVGPPTNVAVAGTATVACAAFGKCTFWDPVIPKAAAWRLGEPSNLFWTFF